MPEWMSDRKPLDKRTLDDPYRLHDMPPRRNANEVSEGSSSMTTSYGGALSGDEGRNATPSVIDAILQDVCELDPTDYPEDDRETIRASVKDLRIILERHIAGPAPQTE